METKESTTTKSKIEGFVKETLQTVISALVLTFIIYYFISTPNQVKGASMMPNIHNNELILTNRPEQLLGNTFIGKKFDWDYKRGEVIIFKLPGHEAYIKRIIGIPGDKVELKDGKVYVNDKYIKESYIPEGVKTNEGDFLKENKPKVVPESSYIVMGDNRENSLDSRYVSVGYVPRQYIVGPAALRIFPLNRIGFLGIGKYEEVE